MIVDPLNREMFEMTGTSDLESKAGFAMRAAVFRDGAADARFEAVTLNDLRDDEVLVALRGTGICHTDLICRNGIMPLPRPIILGHEGAGHVVRVGASVHDLKLGDPVVMSFMSCGKCTSCRKGMAAYCEHFMESNFSGRRLDGSTAMCGMHGDVSAHFFGQSSFATHSVANVRNVVKVRSDAPLEMLGPLGCGVLTGAGSVFNVLKPQPGESFAIFGGGGVGLSALMAAKIAGCDPIIVVEPNAERRALALELGAAHALDPDAEADIVGKLQHITGGRLNNAFDTSGIPAVIGQAIASLAPMGKIALLTGNALDATVQLPLMSLAGRGVMIRGFTLGDSDPHQLIPMLVDLIMAGRFPLDKLVRYYDFADLNRALEDQEAGRAVKPVVRITGTDA